MSLHHAVLLETQYFPPIQFFTKLWAYPSVWIEGAEHYQKGSYRNRCYLGSANGPHRLTVPLVSGKNEQQPIRKTRIAYHQNWPAQHWQAIRSAYGNAPYFDFYAPELESLFQVRDDFLFDFNQRILDLMVRLLGLEVELQITEVYQNSLPPDTLDLRNTIIPQAHRRVPDPFFHPASYPQVFQEKHGFLPNLSILDLLCCLGPQAVITLADSFVKK